MSLSHTYVPNEYRVYLSPRDRQRFAEYEDALFNPYIAADRGYVDAVIRPAETRSQVTRALRGLRTKRQTLPPKKHGNIPL